MDEKKRMTGMIIHAFAVAHAVTAALLAQTMVVMKQHLPHLRLL